MYNVAIYQVLFYQMELTTVMLFSSFVFSAVTCTSPEILVIEQILEGPNRETRS